MRYFLLLLDIPCVNTSSSRLYLICSWCFIDTNCKEEVQVKSEECLFNAIDFGHTIDLYYHYLP